MTSDDIALVAAEIVGCVGEADFLLRLGEALDRHTGIGMFQTQTIDLKSGAAGPTYFSRDYAMNVAGEYERWVMATDPRVAAVAAAPGTIKPCWEWVDAESFETTEVVRGWLDRPDIDMRWGSAGLVQLNEDTALLLAGMRPRRLGAHRADEVAPLQALTPLLARAGDLHIRLNEAAILKESFLALCSRRGEAAFLLGPGLKLLDLNAEAELLLSQGGARRRGPYFEFSDRSSQSLLSEAAAAALAPPELALPTRPFPVLAGSRRLVARVLPMPGASSTVSSGARLALLISDPSSSTRPRTLDLSAFGLSRRECELALALASGVTLQEHADARRISKETARAQLKACLQKLGVRRQTELVSFVLKLS